jgi:hypothetical protein
MYIYINDALNTRGVCVCVRERGREGGREREREREKEREGGRERARAREREGGRERERDRKGERNLCDFKAGGDRSGHREGGEGGTSRRVRAARYRELL